MKKYQYKFDHYRLPSKNILTVASLLDYDEMTYSVGYSVCYTRKDAYVRKVGNRLAVNRLETNEIKILLEDWLTQDQLKHAYLANLAIQAILADIVRTQYKHEATNDQVRFSETTIREIRGLLDVMDEKVIELETERTRTAESDEDEDERFDFDAVDDLYDEDGCDVKVGISAICEDEALIFDSCGRFVPIYKDDIRHIASQLMRVNSLFHHEFPSVDPFTLSAV